MAHPLSFLSFVLMWFFKPQECFDLKPPPPLKPELAKTLVLYKQTFYEASKWGTHTHRMSTVTLVAVSYYVSRCGCMVSPYKAIVVIGVQATCM